MIKGARIMFERLHHEPHSCHPLEPDGLRAPVARRSALPPFDAFCDVIPQSELRVIELPGMRQVNNDFFLDG